MLCIKARELCCTMHPSWQVLRPHLDIKANRGAGSHLQVDAKAQRAPAGQLWLQAVLQAVAASPASNIGQNSRGDTVPQWAHTYYGSKAGRVQACRRTSVRHCALKQVPLPCQTSTDALELERIMHW